MRQAADILASPAAMQIRQLEALQAMAKSASSKVVFVPMQLQSDVIGQLGHGSGGAGPSGSGHHGSLGEAADGPVGRAGILGSMADV